MPATSTDSAHIASEVFLPAQVCTGSKCSDICVIVWADQDVDEEGSNQ